MKTKRSLNLTGLTVLMIILGAGGEARANERPVAEAGLPRYAAADWPRN